MARDLEPIRAGFLPLLDSAILVVAENRGFAAEEGLSLQLFRETSWANIRDRLAVGQFDMAHMLAPMPLAANLGITPLDTPLIAPMAMGLGGNAVTVRKNLWARMKEAGAPEDLSALGAGAALKKVVETDTGDRLKFAVVHPHSAHNYELRYWLSASGLVPDRDVEFVIVPPPLLPDALEAGRIDGFCVGEPWNSVAALRGTGRIATVKAAIWRSSPEKVLGVGARWAETNGEILIALVRALYRAAAYCSEAENHEDVASLLSAPEYLGQSSETILHGLSGSLVLGDGSTEQVADFFMPEAKAATFPWISHALWFYSQMVRWGQVAHSERNARIAGATYRPDLYRAALAPLGVSIPAANAKVEGALKTSQPVGVSKGALSLGPDGFFDGQIFDPDQLDAYIAAQSVADMTKK